MRTNLRAVKELEAMEEEDNEARTSGFTGLTGLRAALRVVHRDSVVEGLRATCAQQLTPRQEQLVAETIAAEIQEWGGDHGIGRRLCRRLLGRGKSGGSYSYMYCVRLYAAARAKVERAKYPLRYSHTDDTFRRNGFPLPPSSVSSISDRLYEAGGASNPDIKPERDALFDAKDDEFFIRSRRGTWEGGYSKAAMTQYLYGVGVAPRQVAAFLTLVPSCMNAEALLGCTEPKVMRSGIWVRNTYQPPLFEARPGCWTTIEKVLANLVNQDQKWLDIVLDWLARPLQELKRRGQPLKMGTALVGLGNQGAGKGILEQTLRTIYGPTNVTCLGQDGIESKFQDVLADKLFVTANEVISSTNRSEETANKLKMWVTDHVIPIEKKGIAAGDFPNRFNIMFTANGARPVVIPDDDRRFMVFETGPRLPETLAKAAWADLHGPQSEVAAFYWHLLERDVQLRVGQVVDSSARRALKDLSATSDQKYGRTLRDQGWMGLSQGWYEEQLRRTPSERAHTIKVTEQVQGETVVTSRRLLEVYQDFCRHDGGLRPAGANVLGKTIGKLFPGAYSKAVKIDGGTTQVWFGLPLEPSVPPVTGNDKGDGI